MEWFYKDGVQEIGPISKDELQDLINAKRVTRDTLVRSAKMNEWKPLSSFMKPKSQTSTSQPPPSKPPQPPSPPEPSQISPPQRSDSPPPSAQPPTPVGAEAPFEFKGTGGEYFKIWIVNVLLSIITLGIYSAWAKVRRKQYFYGNTSVTGAAFRYLADPVKILKGRMIVFSGFIIYSLIDQFIPMLGALLSIGLLFIFPWLIVRSLAFNACNSSWRNIRFNFDGTYGDATKVFILWPILIPFTLGLIAPYVFYRQKKFVVENSWYGTTPFKFHAQPGDYYRIVLPFIIPVVIAIALVVLISSFNREHSFGGMIIIALVYLYGVAYFNVKISNLLYNSSSLRKHRFKATMELNPFLFIVVTNTLLTVLTVGFFYPFAVVRSFRYKIQHLGLLPSGNLEEFVAAELEETSALGEELSDFMDFDFGL